MHKRDLLESIKVFEKVIEAAKKEGEKIQKEEEKKREERLS